MKLGIVTNSPGFTKKGTWNLVFSHKLLMDLRFSWIPPRFLKDNPENTQLSPRFLKEDPENNFVQAYVSTYLSFEMK